MPDMSNELWALLPTLVYFLVGGGLLLFAVWVMDKVVPFSIRKEIEDDQNTALGIIIGCALIAIAIVLHGVLTS